MANVAERTSVPAEEEEVVIQTIKGGRGFIKRASDALAKKHPLVRFAVGVIFWLFPTVLMLIGIIISQFKPPFGYPIWTKPTDPLVSPILVIMLVLAVPWILINLNWVYNRETSTRSLQTNSCVTVTQFAVLVGILFFRIGAGYGVPWWLPIPLGFSILDTYTTIWGSLNNTTQKPFLTDRGAR